MARSLVLNRKRQVPAEDTAAFGAIAERFRRAGDLDRAIALCREGLAKFPDHLSARTTLGWALIDQGKYDEAQFELEQVLKRAPDNLAAIRGLAELHDRMEGAVNLDAEDAWSDQPEPEAAAEATLTTAGKPIEDAVAKATAGMRPAPELVTPATLAVEKGLAAAPAAEQVAAVVADLSLGSVPLAADEAHVAPTPEDAGTTVVALDAADAWPADLLPVDVVGPSGVETPQAQAIEPAAAERPIDPAAAPATEPAVASPAATSSVGDPAAPVVGLVEPEIPHADAAAVAAAARDLAAVAAALEANLPLPTFEATVPETLALEAPAVTTPAAANAEVELPVETVDLDTAVAALEMAELTAAAAPAAAPVEPEAASEPVPAPDIEAAPEAPAIMALEEALPSVVETVSPVVAAAAEAEAPAPVSGTEAPELAEPVATEQKSFVARVMSRLFKGGKPATQSAAAAAAEPLPDPALDASTAFEARAAVESTPGALEEPADARVWVAADSAAQSLAVSTADAQPDVVLEAPRAVMSVVEAEPAEPTFDLTPLRAWELEAQASAADEELTGAELEPMNREVWFAESGMLPLDEPEAAAHAWEVTEATEPAQEPVAPVAAASVVAEPARQEAPPVLVEPVVVPYIPVMVAPAASLRVEQTPPEPAVVPYIPVMVAPAGRMRVTPEASSAPVMAPAARSRVAGLERFLRQVQSRKLQVASDHASG